ncbi:hypothetical protein [Radiobacillus sp. PE A8.2]|uniref:hypothetical protein n=1 Tax=Radiobacillus sp. PE A8.2 TaxID=3380349 RepID=UPI0038909C6A
MKAKTIYSIFGTLLIGLFLVLGIAFAFEHSQDEPSGDPQTEENPDGQVVGNVSNEDNSSSQENSDTSN